MISRDIMRQTFAFFLVVLGLLLSCGKDVERSFLRTSPGANIEIPEPEESPTPEPTETPIVTPTPTVTPTPIVTPTPVCEGNSGIQFLDPLTRQPVADVVICDEGSVDCRLFYPQTAVFRVNFTGLYEIYNGSLQSGAEQWNESGLVLIQNSQNPSGRPSEFSFPARNCDLPEFGPVFIFQDRDNQGAPVDRRGYVGTFLLVAGEDNTLVLRHYCPLVRSNICTQYHLPDLDPNWTGRPPPSNVPSDCTHSPGGGLRNPNSIHFESGQVCVLMRI